MRGSALIAACMFACGGPQSPPAAADVAPAADAQPSNFVLSIVFGGAGDGRVRSVTPGGLDCTLQCQATFAAGSAVDLEAKAFPGSRFEGWDACAETHCTIVMSGDVELHVTFARQSPRTGCNGLVPALGSATQLTVTMGDPNRELCERGTSDGAGNLALAIRRDVQPGGSQVSFVDANAALLRTATLGSTALSGQQPGFEGVVWVGGPVSSVLAFHSDGTDAGGSARGDVFPRMAPNPLDGIVVAQLPDGSQLARVEAFDSFARLRWQLPVQPARFAGIWVDRKGNTLLMAFEMGSVPSAGALNGLWIDRDGRSGASLRIPSLDLSGLDLSPRAIDGFFVRRITDAGSQWIGQIDAMSAELKPAPDWLSAHPNTSVEVIGGGAGYALLPVPGLPAPSCRQEIAIADTGGQACGAVEMPVLDKDCVSPVLSVGYDGTLIEQNFAGTRASGGLTAGSCSWQWWTAVFR